MKETKSKEQAKASVAKPKVMSKSVSGSVKKPQRAKRTAGRPTSFTQELGDLICEELAMGKSMRTVCKPETMPAPRTVFYWLRSNELFLQQYVRAKEEAADAFTDEILDIADDGSNDWMDIWNPKTTKTDRVLDREHFERSRLRIETRKWLASKLKPKKYGDKLDLTNNGKDLPVPILGSLTSSTDAVPANNSPKEDPPA